MFIAIVHPLFISIHAPPRGATEIAEKQDMSAGISIHAPPRGATFTTQKNFCSPLISIHAPPRGATSMIASHGGDFLFQFTPLREGRRAFCSCVTITFLFQFTPLREGRRSGIVTLRGITNDFNSRPSARGDHHLQKNFGQHLISIHAPPRGATSMIASHGGDFLFQFTPLREGRRRTITRSRRQCQFQFTPLREGRLSASHCDRARRIFQFTPLREGRPLSQKLNGKSELFQFTPLREGRPAHSPASRWCTPISIHAPPRGATQSAFDVFAPSNISIHAPPRGATQKICNFCKSFVQPLQISMA